MGSAPPLARACLWAVVVYYCWTSAAAQTPAPAPAVVLRAQTVRLEQFGAVQVCVPFNVAILPTPAASQFGNYSLVVEAEQAVLNSVAATVSNDTLQLESLDSFETSFPIKLIVYLPTDKLVTVAVSSPLAEVTVGPDFAVPALEVLSAFGTANLNIFNLTVNDLVVGSSGTGQIFVNGSISNVTIAAGGTSSVFVLGLEDMASVNLAGAATATIGVTNGLNDTLPTAESASITGVTTGVNSVTYNAGTCEVQSAFLFGAPCVQQSLLVVPTINPDWTCGINVTGAFTCPEGGTATAAEDSTLGTALGETLPSFLVKIPAKAPPPAKPLVLPAAVARPPLAVTPTPSPPPTPVVTATPVASPPPPAGTAGAITTTSPGGQTVANTGGSQPGGRTAIATGPGTQTAASQQTSSNGGSSSSSSSSSSTGTSSSLASQQSQLNSLLGVGRKLLAASENGAVELLNELLGSSNQVESLIGLTALPSTFTSTSGPGSIACAFANGQGGCKGSGLQAANNLVTSSPPPPAAGATLTGATPLLFPTPTNSPPPPASSTSSSSSSTALSTAGGGPPTTFTSTSGPGATACSFANGQGGCTPGASPASNAALNLSALNLQPGTTVFTGLPSVSIASTPPSGAPPGVTMLTSESATLQPATCNLAQNQTLNIFAA